jgi:hypothetical protein
LGRPALLSRPPAAVALDVGNGISKQKANIPVALTVNDMELVDVRQELEPLPLGLKAEHLDNECDLGAIIMICLYRSRNDIEANSLVCQRSGRWLGQQLRGWYRSLS